MIKFNDAIILKKYILKSGEENNFDYCFHPSFGVSLQFLTNLVQ